VTGQKLKAFWARQIGRWHTLRRSFRAGNTEDKYRVVQFIVTHLPMADEMRFRILNRALERLSNRRKVDLRLEIQQAQAEWDASGQKRLQQLLDASEHLEVPQCDRPLVSIILVLKDKAHLSVLTIDSVLQFAGMPFELIIVDNNSTDATASLLDRIGGARIIRNRDNLGFGPACMQGAEAAAGEYLCFFNNDALLTDAVIEAALRNFDSPEIGAVGGKILLSNGSLQEAGSIIWSDGSALGYGRGDDSSLPQYDFRRPVDYCSAVFLITPANLFRDAGGFTPEFAPAYYEDTDYCMTLWQRGLSVIYEPKAVIRHYESASSGGNDKATALMAAHQEKFQRKWAEALKKHSPPAQKNICRARIAVHSTGLRIVYIDDRIPDRSLGAGFPRSHDIVTALATMGHHVTYATSTFPVVGESRAGLPPEVEIFDGFRSRERLVNEYFSSSDVVWISRPHNLKLLWKQYGAALTGRRFKLVYDAEAIFSQRSDTREAILGAPEPRQSDFEPAGFAEEVTLAKLADLVTVVCEADREALLRAGVRTVQVVGHSVTAVPTPASFDDRDAFLFVGSVHGLDNPNADSLRSFWKTSWAAIHRATNAPLLVAGYGTELMRQEISDPTVKFLGRQEDLLPLYNRARVFVVPTRYAAGQPFKAHEAAAHGVPMVVSPLIGSQLNWDHGNDYFAACNENEMAEHCVRLFEDEQLWDRFRANALARVQAELSPTVFTKSLQTIVSLAGCHVADRSEWKPSTCNR